MLTFLNSIRGRTSFLGEEVCDIEETVPMFSVWLKQLDQQHGICFLILPGKPSRTAFKEFWSISEGTLTCSTKKRRQSTS